MKVLIDVSFKKDVDKITDPKTLHSLAAIIREIQNLDKLSAISGCKKLKGSKNSYRIRLGDYRIGFVFENQAIELVRFLHRSKIYDHFPE